MKNIFLLFLCLSTTLVSAQITESLVAHYEFNGDYTDISGNGNNGTVMGEVEFVDGITGKGVMFHGNDGSGLEAVNTGIQLTTTGSFSISLFYKLTAWDQKFGNVLIGDRGENDEGFQIRQYADASGTPEVFDAGGGYLSFTTRGIGSDLSFDPREGEDATEIKYAEDMPYMKAVYPGDFVHLVCVVDVENSKKQIWINNELVVDANFTDPNVYSPAYEGDYILVGARNDGTGSGVVENVFNGVIDEVRIYEKALSQSDIETIFASIITGVDNVSGNNTDLLVSQANGNISFQLQLPAAGHLQSKIYDMSGRVVNEASFTATSGKNTFEVSTSNLVQGIYILKVASDGNNFSQKVILR